MVSRRVLEIKFLLLCHLCSDTVVKKVKTCYHYSWNDGNKNV